MLCSYAFILVEEVFVNTARLLGQAAYSAGTIYYQQVGFVSVVLERLAVGDVVRISVGIIEGHDVIITTRLMELQLQFNNISKAGEIFPIGHFSQVEACLFAFLAINGIRRTLLFFREEHGGNVHHVFVLSPYQAGR